MAVIKRTLCKGVVNGKGCRRWKQLNDEGYCERCNTANVVAKKMWFAQFVNFLQVFSTVIICYLFKTRGPKVAKPKALIRE